MVSKQRVTNVPRHFREQEKSCDIEQQVTWGCLSNQPEIWLVYMLTCAELCEALHFSLKIYMCAVWWHGLWTKRGDSFGHKLCSTYSGFIYILLWEGFFVKPSEIKRFEFVCVFIGCLTSQLTIFQSYMWRHIDVQADWRRSWTYGRAPTP